MTDGFIQTFDSYLSLMFPSTLMRGPINGFRSVHLFHRGLPSPRNKLQLVLVTF